MSDIKRVAELLNYGFIPTILFQPPLIWFAPPTHTPLYSVLTL